MKDFEKKRVVFPILSMVAFFIVVIGASYSFYSVSQNSANIANVNMTVPMQCTFAVTTTNCSFSSTTSNIINGTDSIISASEFYNTSSDAGSTQPRQIAATSCMALVKLTGSVGCTCPYLVSLESNSNDEYVPSNPNLKEYTAQISEFCSSVNIQRDSLIGENNVSHLVGGIANGVLSIPNNSSNVSCNYITNTKFYYLPHDSQTNHGGKNYSYKLKIEVGDCNSGIICHKSNSTAPSKTLGTIYSCNLDSKNIEFTYIGDSEKSSNYAVLLSNTYGIAMRNSSGNYVFSAVKAWVSWCDTISGNFTDCNHSSSTYTMVGLQQVFGNNLYVSRPTQSVITQAGSYALTGIGNGEYFWLEADSKLAVKNNNGSVAFINNVSSAYTKPMITISKELID